MKINKILCSLGIVVLTSFNSYASDNDLNRLNILINNIKENSTPYFEELNFKFNNKIYKNGDIIRGFTISNSKIKNDKLIFEFKDYKDNNLVLTKKSYENNKINKENLIKLIEEIKEFPIYSFENKTFEFQNKTYKLNDKINGFKITKVYIKQDSKFNKLIFRFNDFNNYHMIFRESLKNENNIKEESITPNIDKNIETFNEVEKELIAPNIDKNIETFNEVEKELIAPNIDKNIETFNEVERELIAPNIDKNINNQENLIDLISEIKKNPQYSFENKTFMFEGKEYSKNDIIKSFKITKAYVKQAENFNKLVFKFNDYNNYHMIFRESLKNDNNMKEKSIVLNTNKKIETLNEIEKDTNIDIIQNEIEKDRTNISEEQNISELIYLIQKIKENPKFSFKNKRFKFKNKIYKLNDIIDGFKITNSYIKNNNDNDKLVFRFNDFYNYHLVFRGNINNDDELIITLEKSKKINKKELNLNSFKEDIKKMNEKELNLNSFKEDIKKMNEKELNLNSFKEDIKKMNESSQINKISEEKIIITDDIIKEKIKFLDGKKSKILNKVEKLEKIKKIKNIKEEFPEFFKQRKELFINIFDNTVSENDNLIFTKDLSTGIIDLVNKNAVIINSNENIFMSNYDINKDSYHVRVIDSYLSQNDNKKEIFIFTPLNEKLEPLSDFYKVLLKKYNHSIAVIGYKANVKPKDYSDFKNILIYEKQKIILGEKEFYYIVN